MRRLDDTPLDPEIEASLDAIDATLAGEPVDPRFAELAELALLVAAERPAPRPEFTVALDARVQLRFASEPADGGAAALSAPGRGRAPRRRRLPLSPLTLGGLASLAAAAAIAVVVLGGVHTGAPGSYSGVSSAAPTPSPQTALTTAGGSASSAKAPETKRALQSSAASAAGSTATGSPSRYVPNTSALSPSTEGLTLPQNGRKVVQSAEIDLAAAPNRIDGVAQEVFDVVGAAGGIVDSSQVTQTGGLDGSATFQLRIPSSALSITLTRLSELPDSQVLSRSDNSQDVNSQYVSAGRQLADAQALRTALLKQLAAAVTTTQVDSITAQIADAESTISSAQAQLRSLNSQIDYSRVVVTIAARQNVAPPPVKHGGGFTLGHATHVAGRVLVVVAGVGLIVLAALVPLILVGALAAWVGTAVRRRRREHALDLA